MQCFLCEKIDSNFHFEKDDKIYFKCNNCNLIFLDEKGFQTNLINQYDNENYFRSYIKGYKIYIRIFDKIIKEIEKFKKRGNILDFGCGIGLLLILAKKRNWNEFGIEISRFASNFAKTKLNLNVLHTDNLDSFPDDFFDVVVVNHVLEHLKSPLIILKSIRKKLCLNGILVISVPNIGGLIPRIQKENWPSLQPSQHLYQFTPQTIKLLLKKVGFKPIKIITENRIFKYRYKILNLILNKFINPLLEKLKLGEAMTIIFKRVL